MDDGRVRLLWFSSYPSPYNDVLFRHLHSNADFDLRVYYISGLCGSHPWKSRIGAGYPVVFYKTTFGLDFRVLLEAVKGSGKHYMVAGWNVPTSFVLLSVLRTLRKPYMIHTDTPEMNSKRGRLFSLLRNLWIRWVSKGASFFFATGEPGMSALSSLGVPKEKIRNLPFVLDLSQYPGMDSIESKFDRLRPVNFISIGRLVNRLKGHDTAIRALADCMAGRTDWRYLIVGTGPDLMSLQGLARELGVDRNISFMGWQEPPQVVSLLSECQILIHPSPASDPYPNAVLEGMASACVVMASNVSGSAVDRIVHGRNGFIHDPGDWRQLSSQIRDLLEMERQMVRFGKRAYATACEWNIERSVSQLMEVLKT